MEKAGDDRMSLQGEKALIQHLVSEDSMRILAQEGLPLVCVPDPELALIYEWAMDQFFRSGLTKAPSLAVFMELFSDTFSDKEIEMEVEPEESIEWVIDDLKGSHVWRVSQDFNKRFVNELASTLPTGRVEVVDKFATELVALSFEMSNREARVDLREGAGARLREYEARTQDKDAVYGMRFGIPQIDDYTRGIHPGELAVFAAGPKVGKSWFLDLVALKEFTLGKTVVHFTMENSVEDTLDRMACLACGVDYRAWQHGTCPEEMVKQVEAWVETVGNAANSLHVIQPPPGQRGVEALVRQAQLLGADSLLIDQLSYLEPRDERHPRHIQIREITHTLRAMISTGRHRVPCLLAHQINRDGVKAAIKADRLEMFHLAEGSETERTADWVFGMLRSRSDVGLGQARLQTLAARREQDKHFRLIWNVGVGAVSFLKEYEIE